MKHGFRILLLLLLTASGLHAQDVYTSSGRPQRRNAASRDARKGFDPDKLVYGGGLSLGFGTVTNLGISPIVGYRITDRAVAGIGLGYQYFRYKNAYQNPQTGSYENYNQHVFTPSVFGRYLLFDNFFVQAEYEYNFISYNRLAYDPNGSGNVVNLTERVRVPALPAGIGYRQPVTDRSSFLIMALYDVLQNELSPYGKQVFFRFGFNVGF